MTEMTPERLPRVLRVLPSGAAEDAVDLDHAARFLRRRRLVSRSGRAFLIDLPKAVALEDGAVLELDDGSRVAVAAAAEPLIEVRGDLPRLAWHIGNRHTPCQITTDHLVIGRDAVLADMLTRLGAELRETLAPFRPEGGAYGHGRTFGHDHGLAEAEDQPPVHAHARHDGHHGHAHGTQPHHQGPGGHIHRPQLQEDEPAPDHGHGSGRAHLPGGTGGPATAPRRDVGPRRLNAHFRDRRDEHED